MARTDHVAAKFIAGTGISTRYFGLDHRLAPELRGASPHTPRPVRHDTSFAFGDVETYEDYAITVLQKGEILWVGP